MDDDIWRLSVKLKSRTLLLEYVAFRDLSVRTLADKAGVGRGIVGHLMSGKRKTCSPTTAKAVEKALGTPPGLLFEVRVSNVSASNGRKRAAA